MNLQELETAVRLKLNLVVLILDDNGYGMIRWKQAVGISPTGSHLRQPRTSPSMPKPMEPRDRASNWRRDLAPTLDAAFKASGLHVVTVQIDYSENMRVLVDELKNRVPPAATA